MSTVSSNRKDDTDYADKKCVTEAMPLENYSRVVLLTDRYQDLGVTVGAIGYIIEIYDDGAAYEVEFSEDDGITIALFSVKADEIGLAE